MNNLVKVASRRSMRLTDRLIRQNPRSTMTHEDAQSNLIGNRQFAESLIKKAKDIKMLPAVAIQAIAVADDPESRTEDLANLISQDMKLAVRLLALANSPLFPIYACGKPITCLKTAISRLGFRQTRQMTLVSCYSSMVSELTFAETQTRERLTKHAFLTGCICSDLNRLFKLQLQGEEFTAGLFHDIGRLLLAVAEPKKFHELEALDFGSPDDLLANETILFGTNHARVGAWFLRRNHLPEMLVNVAQHHHQPQNAVAYTRLVALVALAADLANYHLRDPQQNLPYVNSETTSTLLLEMLGVKGATETFQSNWQVTLDQSIETCNQVLSN